MVPRRVGVQRQLAAHRDAGVVWLTREHAFDGAQQRRLEEGGVEGGRCTEWRGGREACRGACSGVMRKACGAPQ